MADHSLKVGEVGFGTPFQAQMEFFRAKLNLPSERWDDIQRSAHDRAFIVAGAMKADLLQDLRQAVDKAMSGAGQAGFNRDFKAIVAKHNWTGWTGEGSKKGQAWRARIIYQTNMATSYAAGRWRQLTDPGLLKLMPFWRYRHADGVLNPRPQHQAWNGLTLRHDHPFWKAHFPPNGWGCHCKVFPTEKPAQGAPIHPPEGWEALDPKTGAPVGIDKGFDYAPGANAATPLADLVDQKLLRLNGAIGAAMGEALAPVLAAERSRAWAELVDATSQSMQANGTTVLATTVAPATVNALANQGLVLENAAVWLSDHDLLHAIRDTKSMRGAALSAEVWRDLPQLLARSDAYLDTADQALIYLVSLPKSAAKIVVRVNVNEKGRFSGQRLRITSNFITTGGVVQAVDVTADSRYVPLR